VGIDARYVHCPRLEKVAATSLAALKFVNEQVWPVHAPLKPTNRDDDPGVAVSVTMLPESNLAKQVPVLQLMPAGIEVTVPEPAPASVTLTGNVGVPQTLATPAPLHVWTPAQVPQLATVRLVPQLSRAVTEPQFLPTRAQNTTLDSGAQAATLCAESETESWGALSALLETVRIATSAPAALGAA
jgi:hypothetical protein